MTAYPSFRRTEAKACRPLAPTGVRISLEALGVIGRNPASSVHTADGTDK